MNIYDIAEKANVSIATVSRIINNKGNVSKKTEEKVLSVMHEMGYTPNVFARALGLNSIKMVGVLCSDVSDIYYAKAVSVIENELRNKGYDAILCCTGTDIKNKKKAIEVLLSKRVDALILIGSIFQEKTDNRHIETAAKNVPVIIINGEYDFENTFSIKCDERKAVSDCIAQLSQKGHKDILYIYDTDSFSGINKKMGYIDGMKAIGVPIGNHKMLKCEKNIPSVETSIESYLDSDMKISAIITSEDILAVGAAKALTRKGLLIPDDVTIIGFNNSIIAQCCSPTLTSVDNRVEVLCTDAVRTLLDIFDGKEVATAKSITANLIYRESFRHNEN